MARRRRASKAGLLDQHRLSGAKRLPDASPTFQGSRHRHRVQSPLGPELDPAQPARRNGIEND
jgi:hypothetical protein